MPELSIYVGRLMFTEKWAIGIDYKKDGIHKSFGVELTNDCNKTAPFPGKIMNLDEIKELHKLLESVINERQSNLE